MQTPEKRISPTQTVSQALEQAYALHGEGDLAAAEQLYAAVLGVDAGDPDALHLLGMLRRQQGRHGEAIDLIGQALAADPGYVDAHVNLGGAQSDAGRLEEAIASYRQAVTLDAQCVDAHHNIGVTLARLGRHEEAVAAYREALALHPQNAEGHYNLGLSLGALGRDEEAVASHRQAVALQPDYAKAHANLAVALHRQGRLQEAEASCRRTLELMQAAEVHSELGVILYKQGRFGEAEASQRRALELAPDYAAAHCHLGTTLGEQGRFDEAEASLRRALELAPEFVEAHGNLGNLLVRFGRLADAEASYRRALELRPQYATVHSNLGTLQATLGRLADAQASFARALEAEPQFFEARSSLLFALNYTDSQSAAYRLEQAREYGRRAARAAVPFSSWSCAAQPGRLRVGVVSGDLGEHPVGFFLDAFLAELDAARVELFAYPTRPRFDTLNARLRPRFAAWKPLSGLDDATAARTIHADGVHVLLDLAGHTADNRLPVFAWKPAPVQACWLGYFATTGLAEMDYLLADASGVPEADEAQFTETIWRLPETRLCFSIPQGAPPVAALPALANGHITFGCFQNLAKLGDDVLAAWARILSALPGAQMRVQCKQLGDARARAGFGQRLRSFGIDPAQVAMHAATPRDAYLTAHAEVDIILDSFPYPGGTTTCEALWMGVPTLTLAGHTLLGRQGASLLGAARLPQWIASSTSDYVDKAVAAAWDLPALATTRESLRAQVRVSPLFDAPRFARLFEQALWAMWHRRQQA